jgi:hypothetical protein
MIREPQPGFHSDHAHGLCLEALRELRVVLTGCQRGYIFRCGSIVVGLHVVSTATRPERAPRRRKMVHSALFPSFLLIHSAGVEGGH